MLVSMYKHMEGPNRNLSELFGMKPGTIKYLGLNRKHDKTFRTEQ